MNGRRPELSQGPTGRDVMNDAEWRAVSGALRLSTREREIARRVFDDHPEAVIADDLGISPHTVHTHLERLYHKTGVGSRCALVVRVFGEYRRLQRAGKFTVARPKDRPSSPDEPTPDRPSSR